MANGRKTARAKALAQEKNKESAVAGAAALGVSTSNSVQKVKKYAAHQRANHQPIDAEHDNDKTCRKCPDCKIYSGCTGGSQSER